MRTGQRATETVAVSGYDGGRGRANGRQCGRLMAVTDCGKAKETHTEAKAKREATATAKADDKRHNCC
eukprot:EW704495.1.p2 GENE.EW704495.1~~EW704495.1.p2  ORF type:complete len:68 (-),score=6.61 EW704495.1:81-284(-)